MIRKFKFIIRLAIPIWYVDPNLKIFDLFIFSGAHKKIKKIKNDKAILNISLI